MPVLRAQTAESLLKELQWRWTNHRVMVRWLSKFFNYLDRCRPEDLAALLLCLRVLCLHCPELATCQAVSWLSSLSQGLSCVLQLSCSLQRELCLGSCTEQSVRQSAKQAVCQEWQQPVAEAGVCWCRYHIQRHSLSNLSDVGMICFRGVPLNAALILPAAATASTPPVRERVR